MFDSYAQIHSVQSIGLALVQYPMGFRHFYMDPIGFGFCRIKKWTIQILLDLYLVAGNQSRWRWRQQRWRSRAGLASGSASPEPWPSSHEQQLCRQERQRMHCKPLGRNLLTGYAHSKLVGTVVKHPGQLLGAWGCCGHGQRILD